MEGFTHTALRFGQHCGGWLALLFCGCDAGKAKIPLDGAPAAQVEQQLNNAVESVKQSVQLAGAIALKLNGKPVNATGCYGQFAALAGRQSVVHLTSYNAPSNEQFPTMLFAAQVAPTTATGLAGQIVSAQAFVQPAAEGPLWQSLPGQPVQIRFTSADEHNFVAEVVSGTVMNVVTGETFSLSGKFNGAWQTGS